MASFGLIFFGIAVGLLSGILGIGGGIVLVPGLMILFNFRQVEAQGTSLAVLSLPVLAFAAYVYYRNGDVRPPVVAEIAGGLIVGAYLGALIMPILPVSVIRLIFGALLLYIGFTFVFNEKAKSKAAMPAAIAAIVTTVVGKLLGRRHAARAMNLPAPSNDLDYHI